jgi:Tfp pilus assembly pilus retraction ATPase PilT
MKRIVLSGLVLCSGLMVQAQSIDKIISVNKVTEIETVLSADDMQGRRATGTVDKASAYIESLFKKIGLKPLTVLQTTSRICHDGVQKTLKYKLMD